MCIRWLRCNSEFSGGIDFLGFWFGLLVVCMLFRFQVSVFVGFLGFWFLCLLLVSGLSDFGFS